MFKIYDYLCGKCGTVAKDSMVLASAIGTKAEQDQTKCPVCGNQMVRLMPAPTWKWTAGSRGF